MPTDTQAARYGTLDWADDGCPPRRAVNTRDGSLLVYVPAGDFEMGDGKDLDCPKHRVFLSAYWIGAFCVTNAQYLRFVQATGHRVPDRAGGGIRAVWKGPGFPPEKADHPVVCVSWYDAAAYAEWAGCALPTEAQWEKAARGPEGSIYPWGNAWDPSRCRCIVNRGSETTSPVDGYAGGVSGYGTYGQSGNVYERCADWYGWDYYDRSPARNPRGPEEGTCRVLRGASWNYGIGRGSDLRCAHRLGRDPQEYWDDLGFRLARPAFQVVPR
jgi:formylglycine-generating enzyme